MLFSYEKEVNLTLIHRKIAVALIHRKIAVAQLSADNQEEW